MSLPAACRRAARRSRAVGRIGLAVALVLFVAGCTSERADSSEGTTATRSPEQPLQWVALGDSYSAGQGGSTAKTTSTGGCPRAEADSYARRAEALLPADTVELTVQACGGATLGELIGTQLAPAAGADVVTLTIGGNDAGFVELITRCLAGECPDLAADDADLPRVDNPSGDRTDWQVLEDGLGGAFRAILDVMAPGGRLFVLTYPLPFPDKPGACPTGFAFVAPADAALVNTVLTRLDDTLVRATEQAAKETTDGRTARILEWRTPNGLPSSAAQSYNPAGICGRDPMLNGFRLDAEAADSFHPSDRGLDIAASLVRDAILAR